MKRKGKTARRRVFELNRQDGKKEGKDSERKKKERNVIASKT